MSTNYMRSVRLKRVTTKSRKNVVDEAESDRARVVFSAPFRRLQEKAQVFSLEDNAAVRSRLTHSLEVAHIGRSLAQSVMSKGTTAQLSKLGIYTDEDKKAAITMVETACHLHDIGNPPFGHFGEKVIKHWFESNMELFKNNLIGSDLTLNSPRSIEFQKSYNDFLCFDGNPQGFRIVSKLQWNYDKNGLNLTVAQLAALLKYDCSPEECDKNIPSRKKPGYFHVDQNVIRSVRSNLNMQNIRHPLSYLMEAADDLAYCLSDIEDGIEKGLISDQQIGDKIRNSKIRILKDIYIRANRFANTDEDQKVQDLRTFLTIKTTLTRELVASLTKTYKANIGGIIKGSTASMVDLCPVAKEALDLFRELATSHLYNSRIVRENEIIANRVITGILNTYKPLLDCNKSRFKDIIAMNSKDEDSKSISVETSLYLKLAPKFIKVYEHDIKDTKTIVDPKIREWILRAHLIVDHVSGMTDKFALSTFRLFCAP